MEYIFSGYLPDKRTSLGYYLSLGNIKDDNRLIIGDFDKICQPVVLVGYERYLIDRLIKKRVNKLTDLAS